MGGEDGFAQFKKAYREQEAKERLLREFAGILLSLTLFRLRPENLQH